MTGEKCSVDDCKNPYYTSEGGGVCEHHHLVNMGKAFALEENERCALLVEGEDDWMSRWGTPEGKASWIEDDLKSRLTFKEEKRKPGESDHTLERRLRAQSARYYGTILKRAKRDASWGCNLKCAMKHSVAIEQAILGHGVSDRGDIVTYYGPTRCGHQKMCRDYQSKESVVERVAGMTKSEDHTA